MQCFSTKPRGCLGVSLRLWASVLPRVRGPVPGFQECKKGKTVTIRGKLNGTNTGTSAPLTAPFFGRFWGSTGWRNRCMAGAVEVASRRTGNRCSAEAVAVERAGRVDVLLTESHRNRLTVEDQSVRIIDEDFASFRRIPPNTCFAVNEVNNEFRRRPSCLIIGILLAIEFCVLGAGSVFVSAWNIDGSFTYPLQTAVSWGCSGAPPSSLAC
jgi:hypothetical protein